MTASEPKQNMSGVLSPVVTPFNADLSPNGAMLTRQCHWMLGQGCGLAVFGTNSEANSLSVEEKMDLLDGLVDAGIDPARMMPGTGACAIPDAVRLTTHAVKHGCGGVLMLPPFYYKNVSDEGLFRAFAEVIEQVGDSALRLYLYHIPPVAQVPLSLDLIERLLKAYPGTVAGIKDSGGDFDNTAAMIRAFPGFAVFSGTETHLLQNRRAGGAGCISATANINPGAICALDKTWQADDATTQQEALNAFRAFMQTFPMIPALKRTVAHFSGEEDWARLRPPLVELDEAQNTALIEGLETRGFTMPELRA